MTSTLVSLRAGKIRRLERPEWDQVKDRPFDTAYIKDEVPGRARAGRLGLEGDEQADKVSHGGPEMALLGYGADHYPIWRAELGREDFGYGALGENLSISGLDETNVCVGDRYRIGDAVVEVASPRGPCNDISRRWNMRELLKRVTDTRRTGWYLRVIEEGVMGVGDAVERVARPQPGVTVARVLEAYFAKQPERAEVMALAEVPELAAEWRGKFAEQGARKAGE